MVAVPATRQRDIDGAHCSRVQLDARVLRGREPGGLRFDFIGPQRQQRQAIKPVSPVLTDCLNPVPVFVAGDA